MKIQDPAKLILMGLAMVIGAVVLVLGVVLDNDSATTTGVGIIGPVVGYLTGNGRLSRSGAAPVPVLGRDDGADLGDLADGEL